MKIAVISASLGGIDLIREHAPQSIDFEEFVFTDDNFPPRLKSMTPRLQAKIPKMFAWQLIPGYDYYFWIDGNITLSHIDSLKYFYENCKDIVVLKHPSRPNIRQEVRYTRKGINQQSRYMVSRYTNELLKEFYDVVVKDKDFIDDLLVNGGIFMYKNTKAVQDMLKEWYYYVTRYVIQDQVSFAYVLKKSGLDINILSDSYDDCKYLEHVRHLSNDK